MADQTDVANALVALAAATIYPNGTSQPSAAGVPAKIYQGWPDPVQLEIDLSGQVGTRTAHVSVFPSPTAKNTTRHLASWEQITAPAPTLQAVVAGQSIALAGTVTVPQAVALIIDGKDYVYAVQAGDTLASMAGALAAAVHADQTASAAGAVITIPNADRLVARIVANGTSGKEVAREERMFTVTVWASCFDDRDPLAKLLEPVFANLDRLTMPDGSAATVRYGGSTQVDSQQKQGIYRRDITIAVDYALILLRTDTTVAIVQTRPGVVVDTTVTPLPIINT
jgi:hypothetical protein